MKPHQYSKDGKMLVISFPRYYKIPVEKPLFIIQLSSSVCNSRSVANAFAKYQYK